MQENAPKPSLRELLKFTSVGRKMMKEKDNYAHGKSGIWVIYNLDFLIIYQLPKPNLTSLKDLTDLKV